MTCLYINVVKYIDVSLFTMIQLKTFQLYCGTSDSEFSSYPRPMIYGAILSHEREGGSSHMVARVNNWYCLQQDSVAELGCSVD